jgi:hypothetical protein
MGIVAVSHRIRYKTRDSGILLNIAKIRAGVWKLRRFRGRRFRSIAINEAVASENPIDGVVVGRII